MPLRLDQLRTIYSEQFHGVTVPAELSDRIKRAMWEAAAAQRQADYETARAQAGLRRPQLVCGNCADYVAKLIREGKPE